MVDIFTCMSFLAKYSTTAPLIQQTRTLNGSGFDHGRHSPQRHESFRQLALPVDLEQQDECQGFVGQSVEILADRIRPPCPAYR